jgi:uncharacterized protein (TIGR02145 family)
MKHLFNSFLMTVLLIQSCYSQEVKNIRFDQIGNKIYIYYDLLGNKSYQRYTVSVFYSTDDGKTWSNPLSKVSGVVGKDVKPGSNYTIVWNVLQEINKLKGDVTFKVEAISQNNYDGDEGIFTDKRDNQQYHWIRFGDQIWLSDDLNYKTQSGSKSSDNKDVTFYTLKIALDVCPEGWHLPTNAEWKIFEDKVGLSLEGTSIKAIHDLTKVKFIGNYNGYYNEDGKNRYVGVASAYWSCNYSEKSTEYEINVFAKSTSQYIKTTGSKESYLSVKCITQEE